jgi:HSP20 family molecular chaperone IbpA
MKGHDFIDIGRIMDEIFEAAEDFTSQFSEKMGYDPRGKGFGWGEIKDFYPAYSYPPANIYLSEDKSLVFEFALAGFSEKDPALEFRGEYMYFSVSGAEDIDQPENVRYFKKRLKFRNVEEQKYYVPEDKFDRSKTRAVFRNGLLRVTVPPREDLKPQPGVKVEIQKEDDT